ncbi:SPAT7 protein, partial [Amia calva]|nr:SPAT7 protein [Amia calva]
MSVHYRKLLSAKASVDTSIPKSLLTSVKYHDQLRRDRLRTAKAEYRRGGAQSRPAVRTLHSHRSRSCPPFTSDRLWSPDTNSQRPRSCAPSPSTHLSPTRIAQQTLHSLVPKPLGGFSLHVATPKPDRPFRTPPQKTYSGDVLDKHPHAFLCTSQPFTPRTVMNQGKTSFLSGYRYYAPPQQRHTTLRGR